MRFERISINPKQMGGLPCLRGLRNPVTTILGQLAAGAATLASGATLRAATVTVTVSLMATA